MSDEFRIQCQSCGTLYNDLEEVCPYCGTPQPALDTRPEEIYIEEPVLEGYDPSGEMYPEDEGDDDFLEDEEYLDDHYLDEEYEDEGEPLEEDYFSDDDIFAVAGEDDEDEEEFYDDYEASYNRPRIRFNTGYADEDDALYDEDDEFYDDDYEEDDEPQPRRRWRILVGCLGAFICIGVLYGSVGVLGAYHGLQESASEIDAEAELSYQQGVQYFENGNVELAIAAFENALKLNPNMLDAREALRQAESVSLTQPTPTSETRSAAAADFVDQAEAALADDDWQRTFDLLAQVQDLDPDYDPERVAEVSAQAYYLQGVSLISENTIDEALFAFEQALGLQPENTDIAIERSKALLYLNGQTALADDEVELAVVAFDELYQADDDYLDVEKELLVAREQFGDQLADDGVWCLAEIEYLAALEIEPSDEILEAKAEESNEECGVATVDETDGDAEDEESTPIPTRSIVASNVTATPTISATETVTETETILSPISGSIFYAFYNFDEATWLVLSVPAAGGDPRAIVRNGTMPAVSANGKFLVYRGELIESEGLHLYDMTTGEDTRITTRRQDILPRWGGDDFQFVYVAQEPASGRWLTRIGFTDTNVEAQIVRDGRTPAWAPNNNLIAYQGAEPDGNNPGIYTVAFLGGAQNRVTDHESDRAPNFSPDGSKLVYMSTRNGNWDVYVTDVAGGEPQQITTYAGQDGLPVWSPDGSRIAYVSDSGGAWGIYVIDAAGNGDPVKVAEWDGSEREDWTLAQISWAP